jgi:hypothetical protein
MNKQELFEKIEGLNKLYGETKNYVVVDDVLNLVKLLDEPQKPVVPQFVANWIEYCKFTHVDLQHALIVGDVYFYNYANQKDFSKLKDFFETENNQEVFARAWLDGYKIEQEKRYLVKMKGMASNFRFLKYNLITENCYMGNDGEIQHARLYHTRKELEEAGFGEVFNSQLFEVEEVEG